VALRSAISDSIGAEQFRLSGSVADSRACHLHADRGGDVETFLELPVVPTGQPGDNLEPFPAPPQEAVPGVVSSHTALYQDVVHHVLDDSVEVRYGYIDRITLGAEAKWTCECNWSIRASDSDPAVVSHDGKVVTRLESAFWTAEAVGHTVVASTERTFNIVQTQTVYLDGSVVWTRSWQETIPRLLM
jgi:hypothetical protein